MYPTRREGVVFQLFSAHPEPPALSQKHYSFGMTSIYKLKVTNITWYLSINAQQVIGRVLIAANEVHSRVPELLQRDRALCPLERPHA